MKLATKTRSMVVRFFKPFKCSLVLKSCRNTKCKVIMEIFKKTAHFSEFQLPSHLMSKGVTVGRWKQHLEFRFVNLEAFNFSNWFKSVIYVDIGNEIIWSNYFQNFRQKNLINNDLILNIT